MNFRTIVEKFNRGRLNPFWTPVLYDNVNSSIDINHDTEILTIDSITAISDAAFIRSVFPICGEYELLLEFRVDEDTDDPQILSTLVDNIVPIPNTNANLVDNRKIYINWDDTTPELDQNYYNTSNVLTNLSTTTSVKDTWYLMRLIKTATNYIIETYNKDLSQLTGRDTIALSSVNQGVQPDYICIGDQTNDVNAITLDLNSLELTFSTKENYYSNGLYHTNSRLRGF